jgi:hypothetical protein
MWFWHDNGPAHFTHAVKDHLNQAFMIARSERGEAASSGHQNPLTWPYLTSFLGVTSRV